MPAVVLGMLNVMPGLVEMMMLKVLYRGRQLIESTIRVVGITRSRLRRACGPVRGALRPLRSGLSRSRRACGGVSGALRPLRSGLPRLSVGHGVIGGVLRVFYSSLGSAAAEHQGASHHANQRSHACKSKH
jgi:hypothetical protein